MLRARAPGRRVVLTSYGRSSGFCIDPIEKKPLNHFLPGTPVLSFGTAGCNLTCKFCQNWDISKARELDRLQDQALARGDRRAAVRSGCRSVAYTYNDPVIFLEYAIDVASVPRARHQERRGLGRLHVRRAARAILRAHGRRQHRPEGIHRGLLQEAVHRRAAPVLETLEYLGTRPTSGSRSRRCSSPGTTTSRPRSRRCPPGSWTISGRTCRCTSRRSIPTTRCWTWRVRRPRR